MYRKETKGLLKHIDFVILDVICLQIAFLIGYAMFGRGLNSNPYEEYIYRNMAIFIELINIVVMFFVETFKNVLKRGYYKEFVATIKHCLYVVAACIFCLYLVKGAEQYSRLIVVSTFVIYAVLSFITRIIWKKILQRKMDGDGERSLLLITNKDMAKKAIRDIRDNSFGRFNITGLVILDQDMTGEQIAGVPVVANVDGAAMYVCKQWVDEVFVLPPLRTAYPEKLMNELMLTGVTVHLNLAKVKSVPGKLQIVEKVGDYTVLTTTMKYATGRQLLAKRCLDICAGLVGCFCTALIFIVVAPMIYIASPGPIFFAQERIGKNGKKFKMYKFRSMYMDAEARKAELMKENKITDGKMFKMDFDPRVIGNKILPDGTKKKGIGQFIRDYSLDEFPQFWNVLTGSMSICGFRPCLESELALYELHQRARIGSKPGITGMWQVSGRSDIVDFDEVVRLDREYIDNWSIGLDLKILFKTVLVVFKKEGSM
ncbi:sugar transferase [Agathobacter sp.]